MKGNLRRFLRLHKKQYYYQLCFSKKIPYLNSRSRKFLKTIFIHQPVKVSRLVNMLLTCNEHFAVNINKKNLELLYNAYDELEDEICDYMYIIRNRRATLGLSNIWHLPNKKQAIKEQIARGFIKKENFPKYDQSYAHIQSIADNRLLYPLNVPHLSSQKKDEAYYYKGSAYIFLEYLGVQGWTRISIP